MCASLSVTPSPSLAFEQSEFLAGQVIEVPLWLAAQLRDQHKCRIIPPDWFSVQQLHQHRLTELNTDTFSPLPYHYHEIAKVLLHYEDIEQSTAIQVELADIQEERQNKLRRGFMGTGVGTPTSIKFKDVSAIEIETIREFATHTMDTFDKIARQGQVPVYKENYPIQNNREDEEEDGGGSQTDTDTQASTQDSVDETPAAAAIRKQLQTNAGRTPHTAHPASRAPTTTPPARPLRRFQPR